MALIDKIKSKAGIAQSITVYDDDINDYIADGKAYMKEAGVNDTLIESDDPRVIFALTQYVKAWIGTDNGNSGKYDKAFRDKVSRLTLETEEVVEDGEQSC